MFYEAKITMALDKQQGTAHLAIHMQKQVNSWRGSEYQSESYITANLPVHHRSALAKFRCGVAPIRIETGRYERLALDDRKCINCDAIESEKHVICECPLYEDLRNTLFERAKPVIHNFDLLNSEEKMSAVLSNVVFSLCTVHSLCT